MLFVISILEIDNIYVRTFLYINIKQKGRQGLPNVSYVWYYVTNVLKHI